MVALLIMFLRKLETSPYLVDQTRPLVFVVFVKMGDAKV